MSAPSLPRLAMVLGDPAGISLELITRLLADTEVCERAHIVLITDEAEVRHGTRIAGCEFPYRRIDALETLDFANAAPLLHPWLSQDGDEFLRSETSTVGGRYSLETLALALELTRSGRTDAILFDPLNKTSLHMAGMDHSDELYWFAERLGFGGPFCEFNVLDDLWTSRVTFHVILAEVPGLLSQERVGEAIRLIDDTLRRSGLARPHVGVCGLNPHSGDNGSSGREELDIIVPTVQKARKQGIAADGPYPADTIFLKVQGDARTSDAVVTVYHDQGQVTIKLMGFSRDVIVQGGLPIPIAMPAHGTVFDIAGQRRADVDATRQAFEIACRIGRRKA